jgi:hypothetical protein
MIYRCCDPRRRELVLGHATLNGIDFLEVLDTESPAPSPRQRTLILRFLKPAPALDLANFELTGGERITGVTLEWLTRADAPSIPGEPALEALLAALPEPENVLALRTSSTGDYATYTLRLVASPGALVPPPGIDLLLAAVDFSFKVECPTDYDCATEPDCPEDAAPGPSISYLAKDYRSFRRLMLQRMAQIMPDWRERSPADLGITLVEMLAYVGDRLSYAQDAVATEAYLGTARSRVSVRRHARLVDYAMHDGANARAFVHVRVTQNGRTIRKGEDRFLTRLTGLDPVIEPGDEQRALDRDPEVFEPLHDRDLAIAHNTIRFYDWGGSACCLPAGATRATLRDDGPAGPLGLAPGDVLVFEERLGPRTGEPADADPLHRHPVRLTAVQAGITDVLDGTPIVEIRWAAEDALPFPLCLSARLDDTAGGGLVQDVSLALGNIVLCDHGRTIADEDLGAVPQPHLHLVPASGDACDRPAPLAVPPRYAPRLGEGPVAQAAPLGTPLSAFAMLTPSLATRRPAVTLASTTPTGTGAWSARRDLLASLASDRHFVVELERDGRAALRFGDDMNGLLPASGTSFRATYRVGNGSAGNVGAGAIHHVVTAQSGIESLRNPLAATGGLNPESIEEVRRAAPYAYRRQERAVTEADYAEVALRHPDVQRAAATFRWNGHGHTVFVSVDRFGGRPVTEDFRADLTAFLDRFRMAGYDVQVDAPRFVALEIEFFVCVCPDHFRAAVRQAVLERLSNRALPGGRRGFFHPDNFSFGDPVRLSALYAAVMEIAGVTSVVARVFQRRGRPDPAPLDDGTLPIDRLEIARLDNDPNFAERGTLTLEIGGGK